MPRDKWSKEETASVSTSYTITVPPSNGHSPEMKWCQICGGGDLGSRSHNNCCRLTRINVRQEIHRDSQGMLQYLQYLRCREKFHEKDSSVVVSMRLPAESGNRLKRMANRHRVDAQRCKCSGWLRRASERSEFAFIDFRDSAAGRQAYIQGSTLAVWEVMLLVQSYKSDVSRSGQASKMARSKSPCRHQLCKGLSGRDRGGTVRERGHGS